MSSTTVAEFASELKKSTETLLEQLKSAGVAKNAASDVLTDADKHKFLNHLQAAHGTAGAELGQPDAGGVAVRGLGQAADQNSLNLGQLVARRLVHVKLAADDVGVHARAADVLADFVDHQQGPIAEC